jgi:putative nucleotidyltransferase with HDIG domain
MSVTLSHHGILYVWGVVATGGLLIGSSLGTIATQNLPYNWLILAALTLLSGPFSIRVPSVRVSISVSEAFVFAAALLFGPAAATVTVALDGLIVSLWSPNRSLARILFNITEPAIAVWVSANLFYWLAGVEPLFNQPVEIGPLVLPLLALTTTYFALNGGFTAAAVWFETRMTPQAFLRAHLPHLSINYVACLCLVVFIVLQADNLSFATLAIIVPLLGMSYATSRTAMARLDDAGRHLAELNKLYTSTVEAFAMAIDAKDQITHGHIRRVQLQSVALARALGVTDETELKALEAAALLHDLGKLAVPEHILNKPGPLTPAEYEQMKSHATVGASILSTIDFPYPVTPLVRHHHENWDGSGYPDGLRGEAIPLGARVLSVVDCFDALTSDRPYRPRLSTEQAVVILHERRGRMYDPRVVDMFTALHRELSGIAAEVRAAPDGAAPAAVRETARQEPDSLARPDLGTGGDWAIICGELTDCLEQAAPGAVWALFRYDPSRAHLAPVHVSSPNHQAINSVQMRLGERVSGWVATRQQTIVNSDAALDLRELAATFNRPLRRCLSTAIVHQGALIGVLTLYTPADQPFSDEQVMQVEGLAGRLAGPLRQALPGQPFGSVTIPFRRSPAESQDPAAPNAGRALAS